MPQGQQTGSTASSSRGEPQILAIPPDGIVHVWPMARAQLAIAAALSNKIDLDEMEDRLISGWGQLWMVWGPGLDTPLCSFVTDLTAYPTGWKVARVLLLGGHALHEWRKGVIERVEQWARDEGCNAVEIIGRKGWARIYPDYHHVETTIAKEL